ncbi:hypothetical protein ACQEU3_03530 [Spirillospora sp. CA-253888]
MTALRFRSIGERSARFTDLTLDFTAPEDGGRVPHDSVVWLRNGGGKSSILSLFYAMLLPGARDFMGRTVRRSLTDYVDTGDTSHVMALWHPLGTSRSLLGDVDGALVTGAVHEWDGLRRPADAAQARERLNTRFYAFHPMSGVLDLATLPVLDDEGRSRNLTDFIAVLRALAQSHDRHTRLVETGKQAEWSQALQDRGLDPAIFRTQKQMNHVEGGVEDLFKFRSAKEFVDFLLDLTTQPEGPESVAGRLSTVTRLLAAKPRKITERDFCQDAAAHLDQVAARHTESHEAAKAFDERFAEAATLASSFAATVSAAKQTQQDLADERKILVEGLSRIYSERSSATDLAYLYRRAQARLLVSEAEQAEQDAVRNASLAQAAVRGWELAQRLAEFRDLCAELDMAEVEAAAEEAEIAPLRAELARHSAVLRARLSRLAEASGETAAQAEQRCADELEQAEEREALAEKAQQDKDTAARDATTADTKLQELAKRKRLGVTKRFLPAENTDATAHRATLVNVQGEQDQTFADLRERAEARRRRRDEISEREAGLTTERNDALGARTRATERRDKLLAAQELLSGSARLRELAEATEEQPLDLWGEGPALARRLENAVIAADNERIRRRAEQHADQRTIEAQERNALLPTSLDAERVAQMLTEAGIPAQPGWAHLRDVLPADRLLTALGDPHLARLGSGVIVPTGAVEEAVRLLEGQAVVTTCLVGVFSARDADVLVHGEGEPGDGVRPAWERLEPGLVDTDAAESAVVHLKERAKAAVLLEKELLARRAADQDLHAALEDFLSKCPQGHLESLKDEIETLDARLREIDETRAGHRAEVASLHDADRLDEATRAALEAERRTLEKALSWLDELLPVLAQSREWLTQKEDAEQRAADASARVKRHRQAALDHRNAANDLANTARREDERAMGLRGEAAALSVAGSDADVADDPGVPLDALRRQWEGAQRGLEVRAAQSVLFARVQRLTAEVAKAKRELQPFPPADHRLAEELLASPQGQEPGLRATALAKARDEERTCISACGRAASQVSERERELRDVEQRHREPPRRTLPVVPTTSRQAHELAEEQEGIGQRMHEHINEAETRIDALDVQITAARTREEGFTTLVSLLPEPGSVADPFAGDQVSATNAARRVNERIDSARARREDADGRFADAIDGLRQAATGYPDVTGPIKDRTLHDPAPVLGRQADDLARRLRLRAQTLTDELDAIAKDQLIISEALADLVKQGMDTLRRAERASHMPTARGSWAGKKVLRIAFEQPAEADLRVYAERVIDRFISQGTRPEGMPLLKAALHESAGPRGFTIKVLKPTDDAVATTEDISLLAKWSGGEKLTVCVALYCTLASLRALASGAGRRSGGVLLLDNPIGRASSAPLVRMQRDVAAAHKVQLVYTTGVKDPAAVVQFPNIIRLDNREGGTRSRRYIVAEGPGPGEPTVTGTLSGVRTAHADHRWSVDGRTEDDA